MICALGSAGFSRWSSIFSHGSVGMKNSFSWNENAESAFRHLKELMTTPPVLGLPDFSKKFIIECDA
jgi:hypothetical protein